MKRYLIPTMFVTLLATILLWPVAVYAQSCSTVSDETGVLQGTINPDPLVDQGADVHVIAVSMAKYGGNLQNAYNAYVKNCKSWQAPNGTAKGNLIVIAVAPAERKKNIFLGDSYVHVFGSKEEVDSLYSTAANPLYKKQQWADGANATIQALNLKLVAFHDQAKHPVQKTTINQATDYSGLWTFFKWLLFLSALGIVVWIIWALYNRRQLTKSATDAAQQTAIRACNNATDAFSAMDKTSTLYSTFAAKYANLSGAVKYDPTTDGLSMEAYNDIASSWQKFENDLQDVLHPSTGGRSSRQYPRPTPSPSYAPRSSAPTPPPYSPQAAPPVQSTVVIHEHDNSGDFTSGLIAGEILADRPRYDDRPVYRDPVYREPVREPDPEPEERVSSGNDSSWGSSKSDDDDSSSSSGSDSSWGSGDSGGGTSSGDDSGF
jgi:uncharacterized membrane protein YgcG